jgi:hypothetical protein
LRRIEFEEVGYAAGLTQASSVRADEGLIDAPDGIRTVLLVPLNPAAVLMSVVIAPGRPSVTPFR